MDIDGGEEDTGNRERERERGGDTSRLRFIFYLSPSRGDERFESESSRCIKTLLAPVSLFLSPFLSLAFSAYVKLTGSQFLVLKYS